MPAPFQPKYPRAALVYDRELAPSHMDLNGLPSENMTTIEGKIGDLPPRTWKARLSDACWFERPRLAVSRGTTWVTVMESLLDDPGEEALEALFRLGGEDALRRVASERWADPRFARASDP